MTVKEFFQVIEEQECQTFTKIFGGFFFQDIEAGYMYAYEEKDYLLPDDFMKLVQESVNTNRNLLLELKNVYPKITAGKYLRLSL